MIPVATTQVFTNRRTLAATLSVDLICLKINSNFKIVYMKLVINPICFLLYIFSESYLNPSHKLERSESPGSSTQQRLSLNTTYIASIQYPEKISTTYFKLTPFWT
jgi:hypothetical protein